MGIWIPSSAELLARAETAVLRCVRSIYTLKDVVIELPSKTQGLFSCKLSVDQYNIRTICFEDQHPPLNNNRLPFVMIHGFGSGLGLWVLNYDTIAQENPLYAFDLLGFARSSRNFTFSKDAQTCIDEYVESIEQWRQAMKLEKFVLLGHSFGAYLSFFYRLKHPHRVQHLILADPWGMNHKTEEDYARFKVPWALRPVVSIATKFNPLAVLRGAGPLAPSLIPKLRGDILQKFNSLYSDSTIGDYIYHCNVQTPSGETAFSSICFPLAWPRISMLMKADEVPFNSKTTIIYGRKSWMNKEAGYSLKHLLQKRGINVKITILPHSSHHVYADEASLFNDVILGILETESLEVSLQQIDEPPTSADFVSTSQVTVVDG